MSVPLFRKGELVRCETTYGRPELLYGALYIVEDCWIDSRDKSGPFVRIEGLRGQFAAYRFVPTNTGILDAVDEYEEALRDIEAYDSTISS